jgi:hypothetical protein
MVLYNESLGAEIATPWRSTYHSATLETWTAQVGSDSAFAGSASAASAGGEAAAAATVAATAASATPLARWAAGGGGLLGSRRGGGGEGASAATSRREAMGRAERSLVGVHGTREFTDVAFAFICVRMLVTDRFLVGHSFSDLL